MDSTSWDVSGSSAAVPISDAAALTPIGLCRASSGLVITLNSANASGAPSTIRGPLALSNEISCPEPSSTTTTTPANAIARPAARVTENRSSPRAHASARVIPGAVPTITAAVPDDVYRSPTLRARW